jgi:hypothetical protein
MERKGKGLAYRVPVHSLSEGGRLPGTSTSSHSMGIWGMGTRSQAKIVAD